MKDRLRALTGAWDIHFGPPRVLAESMVAGDRHLDLAFSGTHGQEVPATLVLPDRPGPHPAVLWAHAHGGEYRIGRRELTEGRPALTRPPVPELSALGFAVLCLEMPCFGSRATAEGALAKALLWEGRTLFGQMLAEQAAGLTYLAAHPQIDARRLGMAGISMGATLTFWLAALDARLRAAAHLCCFSDLATLVASGAHDGHGPYMTVPGLLPAISTGRLAGLAAPRAQLVCVGLNDGFTPPDAFAIARAELEEAYADAPDQLEILVDSEAGHAETPEMRACLITFFQRHLGPN